MEGCEPLWLSAVRVPEAFPGEVDHHPPFLASFASAKPPILVHVMALASSADSMRLLFIYDKGKGLNILVLFGKTRKFRARLGTKGMLCHRQRVSFGKNKTCHFTICRTKVKTFFVNLPRVRLAIGIHVSSPRASFVAIWWSRPDTPAMCRRQLH